MISFKTAFSSSNINSSVKSVFPKEPQEIRKFFDRKRLLLSFTDNQMDNICEVLAGKSITPLDVTAILHWSIELERKETGIKPSSKSEVRFQNSEIGFAVQAVQAYLRTSEH